MENKTQEMMTVREWAEKAGLILYNYDGFRDIYLKLSGKKSEDFLSYTTVRFRDAGDLICTRRAFESRLMGCSMEIPKIDQYEQMADIIPDFIEKEISYRISFITGELRNLSLNKEDLKAEVEELLTLIKLKIKVKEKSIKVNGITKETQTSDLEGMDLSKGQIEAIKGYPGTVESVEEMLSQEIIQSLENALDDGKVKKSKIPLAKIKAFNSILYSTERYKEGTGETEEEFMYLNVPGQIKSPFIKPYNIIGEDGIKSEVAFEGNGIKGTIRTTPTIDKKIRDKIGDKGITLTVTETDEAIQKIDNMVTAEERKGLMARMKAFIGKVFKRIDEKGKGR